MMTASATPLPALSLAALSPMAHGTSLTAQPVLALAISTEPSSVHMSTLPGAIAVYRGAVLQRPPALLSPAVHCSQSGQSQ